MRGRAIHAMKAAGVAIMLACGGLASAQAAPEWAISLDQTVQAALAESPAWRAAQAEAAAGENRALAQRGLLWPKLSLEGSYRYVTEIPELSVIPGSPAVAFADHKSYSIGPQASWTVFDGRARLGAWRALQADALSKRLQAESVERQLRLAARLAYFQAQLASEQVRLFAQSHALESAQSEDIRLRHTLGSASRIDFLSARQQALSRQRQLLQARGDLAAAARELAALTQLGQTYDPAWPLGRGVNPAEGDAMPPASVVIALDAPADSIARMTGTLDAGFDERQPQIRFFEALAAASRASAESLSGEHWPSLTVLARTSLDYPNGPVRERIHQNTLGANLSFPLFAGGRTAYGVRKRRAQAQAAEQRGAQTVRDLLRDWRKARDQAANLRVQQRLTLRALQEAEELARLQYQSYKAGHTRYLDVQDANLRVLQARVDAARADIELLIQLALLESLSAPKR